MVDEELTVQKHAELFAQALDTLPICYENAYGGVDEAVEIPVRDFDAASPGYRLVGRR